MSEGPPANSNQAISDIDCKNMSLTQRAAHNRILHYYKINNNNSNNNNNNNNNMIIIILKMLPYATTTDHTHTIMGKAAYI